LPPHQFRDLAPPLQGTLVLIPKEYFWGVILDVSLNPKGF
jgi:hypothetical protein